MSVASSQAHGTCASHVLRAQRRPSRGRGPATSVHGRQAAVDQQHGVRACGCDSRIASSSSGLYGITLPPREPASALTITLGCASSMREASDARGEAAEHHRVDRADARAGQHREHGLGDHRHVDQHAVALPTPSDCRIAAMRCTSRVQFAEAVGALCAGFGGDVDQRRLVGRASRRCRSTALWHRLVVPPTNQRANGGWLVVADLARRRLPVDQLRLLGPEGVAVLDRAAVEIAYVVMRVSPWCALFRPARSDAP